jgi:adenine phosphoribosyltransferase
MDLKTYIRNIPDFPKEGIQFKDITTLLKDGPAFRQMVDQIANSLKDMKIDCVVGPEARGFIMSAPISYALGVGLVPARKPGKLPAETCSYEYELEYGTDKLEIHKDAIKAGMRVAIVDDLLATGGTSLAAAKLVEQMGGEVVAMRFAIELLELGGREKLAAYDVDALIAY